MDIIKASVLGVVQGLTEFLPISSTAHLKVVPALMGWGDPGAGFTSIVQLGTTFAVIVYFWRDLAQILVAWLKSFVDPETRKSVEAKQGWAIFAGTLPIGIFGVMFKDQIETTFRSLHIISNSLIGLGLLMLLSDRIGSQRKSIKDINTKSGLWFGLWQALALIPGMSRSGSTITGGLLAGFNRQTAARFSFLLSTPAILAAALFNLKSHPVLYSGDQVVPIIVATLIAFITGYFSIRFLMKFLQTHNMLIFVIYRLGLGVLLHWLISTNRFGRLKLDCLVIGLGNPGQKYDGTRHNVGFALIDFIARSLGVVLKEYKYQSVFGIANLDDMKVGFVKPLTYMNLSGQAVAQISAQYKVLSSRILVIADDLDLAVGQVRYREKGGAGGHNGHRSLIHSLKTQDYPRLKIGIGRPVYGPIDRFVLEKFNAEEFSFIDTVNQQCLKIVPAWIKEGSIGVNKILSLKV